VRILAPQRVCEFALLAQRVKFHRSSSEGSRFCDVTEGFFVCVPVLLGWMQRKEYTRLQMPKNIGALPPSARTKFNKDLVCFVVGFPNRFDLKVDRSEEDILVALGHGV